MMKVVFSSHALLELTLREIDKSDVELTIAEPDKTVEGRHGRRIYQKVIQDELLLKPMLCRVVVEELENTYSVITVYKTSNIKKYM
jgi:hypothetical protein